MSKQPETVFKEKILPKLRELGFFEKIQQVCISGTPDILGCIAGHFVAIELKKDKRSKPSKLQIHKLHRIYEAGGLSFVVYPENWEKVYDSLKSIKDCFSQARLVSRANLYPFTRSLSGPQV